MASIKDLDNPLLVLILNRLCIQKLFTAGHVCVRWNAIRATSAATRKELVLMIGNDAKSCTDESVFQIPERQTLVDENGERLFPENDQNVLQIHSFPLEFSRLLYAYFSNLTSLIISTRVNFDDIEAIIHLLEQFNQENGQLRSLKLYSTQDDPKLSLDLNPSTDFKQIRINTNLRLLAAVNSIGSLKKLTFDVDSIFVDDSNQPQIDLPILAQLEEFEFNSADYFDCLYDSITRYAVNNQGLRRIGIHHSINDFARLLALPTELLSRFTHLYLYGIRGNENKFENLCNHFVHLTSLKIVLGNPSITFFPLFRHLTNLPNLLSLEVTIDSLLFFVYTVQFRDSGRHFELPSVKVLTFNITNTIVDHNIFQNLNFGLFPNVQVVRVIREGALCAKCKINVISKIRTGAHEEKCARHMFRYFSNSQNLRMVISKIDADPNMAGPRYRQWAWNEMEPFEEEEDDD